MLDFSNRTFQEFVVDAVGLDIYEDKYIHYSGSKANRLRGFWTEEPDHLTAKLLAALIDYAEDAGSEPELVSKCQAIAKRLRKSAPVSDLEAIEPNAGGSDFEALAESVRAAIDQNRPESGLDRLHTFTVKYLRVLCRKRGIDVSRSKPLHSLLGQLVKALKTEGAVESAMAERILKSSISILDAFNDVRNNRSLAHDNELLTYPEALLIFNNVSSSIRFLASIEAGAQAGPPGSAKREDEIPF